MVCSWLIDGAANTYPKQFEHFMIINVEYDNLASSDLARLKKDNHHTFDQSKMPTHRTNSVFNYHLHIHVVSVLHYFCMFTFYTMNFIVSCDKLLHLENRAL